MRNIWSGTGGLNSNGVFEHEVYDDRENPPKLVYKGTSEYEAKRAGWRITRDENEKYEKSEEYQKWAAENPEEAARQKADQLEDYHKYGVTTPEEEERLAEKKYYEENPQETTTNPEDNNTEQETPAQPKTQEELDKEELDKKAKERKPEDEKPKAEPGAPESTLAKTPFLATEHTDKYIGNNLNVHEDYITDEDFNLPIWGYDNFILERANFQKSVTSLFAEPAFFYFKLFFKFDTHYGLLGSSGWDFNSGVDVINKPSPNFGDLEPYNTALSYLGNLIRNMRNYYGNSELQKRYQALEKFINILSYINIEAPWFFKSIKGLDKVEAFIDLKNDDNVLEIGCMQEAVDMRLETLLGLYRYACYDNYNHREIIPENLRMFDMAIMVFETPIRYYHTGIMSRSANKNFEYKSIHGLNNSNISNLYNNAATLFGFEGLETGNRMSYKIILFKNCEILADTYKTTIPGEINNERPTPIENIAIKIKYQRALVYNYNEFYNLFYGDVTGNTTGLFNFSINHNNTNDISRFEAIKKNISKLYYYNPYSTQYKDLIDASEAIMTDGMRMVLPEFCMGNIYGTKFGIKSDFFKKKLKALKKGTIKSGNLYGDATDVNSAYSKEKLKRLKSRSIYGNLYGDTTDVKKDYFKFKQKELKKKSVDGNLYGTATNIEKKYFEAKLKELKKKSLEGNLYNNTTNVNEKYYQESLRYFKKTNKSDEDKLKVQDAYNKSAKENFLNILSNDYTSLIESNDIKYVNDKITEQLDNARIKTQKTGFLLTPSNNDDLKSLINEKGLNIDQEKVSFWQQLKNQFWGGGDTLTDTIKNFDLKGLIKF